MFKLICILALLIAVNSQSVEKCQPEQYEGIGHADVITTLPRQGMKIYTSSIKYSVDFKRKMIVVKNIKLNIQNTPKLVHVYEDWNSKKAYIADPIDRKCPVVELPSADLRPICTNHNDVHHLHTLTIGKQVADVYDTTRYGVTYKMTFLREKFIPTYTLFDVKSSDSTLPPQVVTSQLGNITLGIQDPKVFELPPYCRRS